MHHAEQPKDGVGFTTGETSNTAELDVMANEGVGLASDVTNDGV